MDLQAAFCPNPACLARARAAGATFRFIANVSSASSVASVASPFSSRGILRSGRRGSQCSTAVTTCRAFVGQQAE